MPDPRLHDAILALLAKGEITSDRMDAESAVGWVVVTFDLEEPCLIGLFGNPFETEMDATIWADHHLADTNKGLGPDEKGWTATVLPLMPHA